jgi:VWFA-related protein
VPIFKVLALSAAALAATAALSAQQPAQEPKAPFRSATTLVPIDVRVIDRSGKPITGLSQSDFIVTENGIRQTISTFSAAAMTASSPSVPLLRAVGRTESLEPQQARVFLLLMGRGIIQGPSKGVTAMEDLVRERLLPQDRVAVMAWNRATDFSADHDRAAAVIERFRTRHESIEMDLQLLYSGLSGLYAGRQIPRPIQVKIDDVFNVLDAGTRAVVATDATDKPKAAADEQLDLLQRKSEIEARAAAFREFNTTDRELARLMSDTTLGSDFDSYVALSRQTLQDVGNVYAGVDYMRFIEGEKHLLLVTEQGFLLPSADHDRDIASLASDARVAIDTFQTGGVATVMSGGFATVTPQTGFALSALRSVSQGSGGQVSISERGNTAIDRLVHATEFGYVLGYSPKNPALDGKFRAIKVEVARKDATVSFRRGYFARAPESFDPRKSIATTRMVAAANYGADVSDLKVAIKVANSRTGANRFVTVDATVATDRIVFAKTATGSLAAISQAVICLDSSGRTVGEVWRTLDVKVALHDYDLVRKDGLKLSAKVDVTTPPATVRVIIYDYGSDLIGSTRTRIY